MLLHFIYHSYCLKHTFPLLLILSFYFYLLQGRGPCLAPSQIGRKKNGIMAVGSVVTVGMEGNTGLTLAVRKQHGTHSMTSVHVSVSTPCGPRCPSLLATCSRSCCGMEEGDAGILRQRGSKRQGLMEAFRQLGWAIHSNVRKLGESSLRALPQCSLNIQQDCSSPLSL